MSLNAAARWIVTYDISDRKRGGAVHRYMKKQGVPLQYSVFMVEASSARIQKIMLELETLISVSKDDVRAYLWPARTECHQLGPSLLPAETLVIAEPSPSEHRAPAPAEPAVH